MNRRLPRRRVTAVAVCITLAIGATTVVASAPASASSIATVDPMDKSWDPAVDIAPGRTYLYLEASAGNPYGLPTAATYTTDDAVIALSASQAWTDWDDGGLHASFELNHEFDLDLATGPGQIGKPRSGTGTFTRHGASTTSCKAKGWLGIDQLSSVDDPAYVALARFGVTCGDSWLRGELRRVADDWRSPLGPIAIPTWAADRSHRMDPEERGVNSTLNSRRWVSSWGGAAIPIHDGLDHLASLGVESSTGSGPLDTLVVGTTAGQAPTRIIVPGHALQAGWYPAATQTDANTWTVQVSPNQTWPTSLTIDALDVVDGHVVYADFSIDHIVVHWDARPLTLPSTPSFSDVKATHPFATAIEWLNSTHVLTGYADGSFRPSASLSRQAGAALIERLLEPTDDFVLPAPALPAPFTDVPAGHPFRGAIDYLRVSGKSAGYADGTFRPTAPLSRAAFAYWIAYWGCFVGKGTPGTFSDLGAASPVTNAIDWLAQAGIISGYPDGTFRPTEPITRQAAAAWIERLQR